MNKRNIWTLGFFSATLLAIALELFAIHDGNPDTLPWTYYIINFIPWWIGMPGTALFCVWLLMHFWKYYKTK